jgi:hypothetical protein
MFLLTWKKSSQNMKGFRGKRKEKGFNSVACTWKEEEEEEGWFVEREGWLCY